VHREKLHNSRTQLLNEHKKEMLAKGSWDFIFLEMGRTSVEVYCLLLPFERLLEKNSNRSLII
jgi:hypothetical protein